MTTKESNKSNTRIIYIRAKKESKMPSFKNFNVSSVCIDNKHYWKLTKKDS